MKAKSGISAAALFSSQTTAEPVAGFATARAREGFAIARAREGFAIARAREGFVVAPAGGEPLPNSLRSSMETSFSHDFSAVRVHQSERAAEMGAIAVAYGDHLHFAPGRYQPATSAGRQVIGHELTHVVQQRQGLSRTFSNSTGTLEGEATSLGERAATGRICSVRGIAQGPQFLSDDDAGELWKFLIENKVDPKVIDIMANSFPQFDNLDDAKAHFLQFRSQYESRAADPRPANKIEVEQYPSQGMHKIEIEVDPLQVMPQGEAPQRNYVGQEMLAEDHLKELKIRQYLVEIVKVKEPVADLILRETNWDNLQEAKNYFASPNVDKYLRHYEGLAVKRGLLRTLDDYKKEYEDLTRGIVNKFTKEDYLQTLKEKTGNDAPLAFVVNAILPYRELKDIPDVISSLREGIKDFEGRVGVVLGVNAPEDKGAEMAKAVAGAGKMPIEGQAIPVAIVQSTFKGKFPFGTMRNEVLHSAETKNMIAAFARKGYHPYLSFQDFDTGSRRVPSGKHIFNYLEHQSSIPMEEDPGEVGDYGVSNVFADNARGDEPLPGVRPLMYSGGYGLPKDSTKLVEDTKKRFETEKDKKRLEEESAQERLKTLVEKKASLRKAKENLKEEKAKGKSRLKDKEGDEIEKIEKEIKKIEDEVERIEAEIKNIDAMIENLLKNSGEIVDRFDKAILGDMVTRERLSRVHAMLPYTPEPNLFIDALPTLLDEPKIQFGPKGAEFAELGKSLNRFLAYELQSYHAGHMNSEMDQEEVRARFRIDAQTGSHPLRGQSYFTDFVGGRTETDLSRIMQGYLASGEKKLPQGHEGDLAMAVDRYFQDKSSKKGVSFAEHRDNVRKVSEKEKALFYPRLRTQEPFEFSGKEKENLGAKSKNQMSDAISHGISEGLFEGEYVGISKEHKLFAAHTVATHEPKDMFFQNLLFKLHNLKDKLDSGVPSEEDLKGAINPELPEGEKERILNRVSRRWEDAKVPDLPGDCLYSAVSQALNKTPEDLRDQVVTWALSGGNLSVVAEYAFSKRTELEDLLKTIESNGNRSDTAGDLVPRMVASTIGRSIRIVQNGEATDVPPLKGGSAGIVTIYLQGSHYSIDPPDML